MYAIITETINPIIPVPNEQKDIAYRVTGGKVRAAKKLSVNSPNVLADNVFMPADKRFKVNFYL